MASTGAAAGDAPEQVLGRVVLLTGPEEFLAERSITAIRARVRASDAESELTETTGDQLSLAGLGELSAPSLFSSTRCVVVRKLEDLPEESVDGIVSYATAPADEVALVLVHGGGQRGSGLLTKLRKLGSVVEIKSAPLSPRDLPGFVANELRRHQVRVDPEAAAFLVQAVGNDLRGLSAAADQLANDFVALRAGGVEGAGSSEGRASSIDIALVKQYFGGRAEAKSFAVADLALSGHTAKALEELRWALDRGTAPVLVTSAVSGSLRQLVRLGGLGSARGGRDADVARDIGVPPWKVRTLRAQLKGWDGDGLAGAIRVVARTDADVKGQASDASYALERMVLSLVRLRRRG